MNKYDWCLAGLIFVFCFGCALVCIFIALALFFDQVKGASIDSEPHQRGYYASKYWADSVTVSNEAVAEPLLVAELTMTKSEVYEP